jgi:2-polyprenyl-6-methoxyphenol hydroxylase-like FAD-dependent oxidoreductase
MPRQIDVIIIGAGTGGLCLAQGLHSAGIRVRVFEKDRTPTDRLQGYRLHISATGNRALQACLPSENFEHFVRSSAKPNSAVSFFDHRLNRLLIIDIPPAHRNSAESERPVSRIALRKILLNGLDDIVTFDKNFKSYAISADGRVTAHFQDGSTATGDILVGADGASSTVCRQLLPDARRIDHGIDALSGKFPLDEAARRETPGAVFEGPTLIMGARGCFMFASAMEYETGAERAYDAEEYIMWGFSAPRALLCEGHFGSMSGDQLKSAVLSNMRDWNPALYRMVERANADTMTAFAAKSAVKVQPWRTGSVTLLGDALHNMTPFRGMGANMALRDAAALRDCLVSVAERRAGLTEGLAAYEREMLKLGFAAVGASQQEMRRLHARSAMQRFFAKASFRLVDRVRPLQRLFRGKR